MKTAAVAFLVSICAASANAQVVGNWEIKRSVDKMSDKVVCQMWHRKSKQVFVEDAGNIIIYLGRGRTPQSYQYRVGTQPPADYQPSTMYEKDMKLIQIWAPDEKLGDAKQLLVRGSTILGEPFEHQVDLTGFREARAKFVEKCPAGGS
jgi:hypothetical protein